MTTVTPNYSQGTFGSVVSVTVSDDAGVRTVARPAGGMAEWQPPAANAGTIHIPHPDYPDLRISMVLGERAWPAVMVQDDDQRVSEWGQLVAAGLITLEMLADIPEPEANIFEREKVAAQTRLQNWWDALIQAGAEVNGITVAIDKASAQVAQSQAITVQLQAMAGSPPETVKIYDAYGVPHVLALADYMAGAAAVKAHVSALEAQWDARIAALNSCTTSTEITALGW
jgi:hypothetical protein